MTREEKLQLNRDRQKAVRDAWQREKELVGKGQGTVDWTAEQQKELMDKGRVKGYEGQHMKSVSVYPEYARSADNIQFLTHDEHVQAHNSGENKSGYRSPTNGYYDTNTKTMHSFCENPPSAPVTLELSNPCYKVEQNQGMEQKRGMEEQSHEVNSQSTGHAHACNESKSQGRGR